MEITPNLAFFYPEGHEAHFEAGHPERPERVETLRRSIQAAGWWDPYPKLTPILPDRDLLQSIHTRSYLSELEAACRRGQHLDMDTYTTPSSWQLALNSAGGAMATAVQVWHAGNQEIPEKTRGFALTRPPGHHATAGRGMGFCLLNNVALAAEYLLQKEGAKRLAIVDLDLHHGNGTQDIFWRRGEVFYISTHQSPLYPGTGTLEETGAGPGQGCTANFPLPPGSGDQAFQEIMDVLILPLLDRFSPEIVLVSFGFDTHWRDPLGHLQLSAAAYGDLIARLAGWVDHHAHGKIALFLEGGYDLDAAAACGQSIVAALLNQVWRDPLGPSPRQEGRSWQAMVRQARAIWGV
jgi:acetoin utilization deacetylase AcuC-like enzyme